MSAESITLPDRDTWLKERMTGLGASDAAAVVGVSPFKGALALYAEKLGVAEAPGSETEAMEWGLLLEPVIADKYQRETGRPLRDLGRFTIHRSRAHAFMLATLDREVLTPNDRGVLGVLEVKTASAFKAEEWADEAPVYYQVQVQHQLAVTGHAWGSLAVLIGGQRFLWVDIERNDKFIALLIEREAEFWDRVQRLDPPAPDAGSREVLARLYPQDTGASLALPPAAVDWDARRQEALAQLKHWEAVRDEAENLLKASIGEAAYGVLPGGARYSWKLQRQERAAQPARTVEFRSLRRLTK